MESFVQFMQSNWQWIAGLGTPVAGGAGWLIKQRLDKKSQPNLPPTDVTTVAITALTEKYGRQMDDQQQTIASLRKAVDALTAEKSDPAAPEGVDDALSCLEQGDTNKAEAIFQQILEAKEAEGRASSKEAAQAAMHIGALAFLHDTQKALDAYKKAAQLDPDDAYAWNELGSLLLRKGDLPDAERAFNKVLALGNVTANKQTIATATGNLGIIAKTRGDLNRAEDYYQQALAINTELGRKEGIAGCLGNLGLIAKTRGELDRAEDYHQQSLAISTELDHKEGMASQLGNLGIVAQARGALDRAKDYNQQSLAISTELDHKEGMASTLGNLGIIAQIRGELQWAEDYLQQALAIDTVLGRKEYMANQLGNLGGVAAQRGDLGEACRLWREARDLFQTVGMKPQIAQVQGLLDEAGCDAEAPEAAPAD